MLLTAPAPGTTTAWQGGQAEPAHLGQAVQAQLHVTLPSRGKGHRAGHGCGQCNCLPFSQLMGFEPGFVHGQQRQPLFCPTIAQALFAGRGELWLLCENGAEPGVPSLPVAAAGGPQSAGRRAGPAALPVRTRRSRLMEPPGLHRA